jgi:transposase InsO family protein
MVKETTYPIQLARLRDQGANKKSFSPGLALAGQTQMSVCSKVTEVNAHWILDHLLLNTLAGRCWVFTLLDHYSGHSFQLSVSEKLLLVTTQASIKNAFRHYGVPKSIMVDYSKSINGLHERNYSCKYLTPWLQSFGIVIIRPRTYDPSTIERAERFYRQLEIEILRGRTFVNLGQVQSELDQWRVVYNEHHRYNAIRE